MFWVKTTFMTECKFIYFKMSTLLRSTAGVPVWRGLVRGRGRCWRWWWWWRGRRCRGCVRRSTARCPRCVCTQTHCTVLHCKYCTVLYIPALRHPRGGRVRGAGEGQLRPVPQPDNAETIFRSNFGTLDTYF